MATVLQNWTFSPALQQDDTWNTLRLIANGNTFSFEVNGTAIWSEIDNEYRTGRVGLTFYRTADSTGDIFWADWATLDNLSAATSTELDQVTINTDQEQLNSAADKNPIGDDRFSP